MSTTMITSQQILDDRANRRDAGLAGCLTGKPVPEIDFFGYNDVQIWFLDASGRLNGDPGFNYKDPHCFCFDCRGAFDPKGEVDAELVNEGHVNALYTYRNLVPDRVLPEPAQPIAQNPQQGNPPLTSPPGGDDGEMNDNGDAPGLSNIAPEQSNP